MGKYEAQFLNCSRNQCLLWTPPGNEKDIGINLPITVQFEGGDLILIPYYFTFHHNPSIKRIYPLETIAAGGTQLTVTGEGFDAVSKPELIVSMVHTIEVGSGDVSSQTVTNYTGPCTINSSTMLKCQTPKLDIPENFHNFIDYPAMIKDDDFNLIIEGQSLQFYLGIRLDGDDSYTNLAESLPEYSKIHVFLKGPDFQTFTNVEHVKHNEHLQITGSGLTDGLGITDYTVRIGSGHCSLVDLTSNELVCIIPEEESVQVANETDKQSNDEQHSVLVHPGRNLGPHFIGMFLTFLNS